MAELQDQISALNAVEFYYPLIAEQLYSRLIPGDGLFFRQWHLRNTGQKPTPDQPAGTAGEDANIVDVWDTYRGTGVVIGIVDDGVEYAHSDLSANYVATLSYDFNDNDADPAPAAGQTHGTQMAGIVATPIGNMPIRGALVQLRVRQFAGLRLTAAATTDAVQAAALSYQNQSIDIYNNSWGSADNGTLSGPGPLTLAAIDDGVTNGRGGLGNIYVWAAGNGAASGDNVNYDGYANSRYAIAVSAVDHNGHAQRSTASRSADSGHRVFEQSHELPACGLLGHPDHDGPGYRRYVVLSAG